VVKARRYYGYGRVVFIDHGDGLITRYGHLQTIDVKEGEHVPASALIGTVGSSGRATGPHLHFETRVDGNPIDPARVMDTRLVPAVPRLFDILSLLVLPLNHAELQQDEPSPI
jgi:murein DD-endopeptidase MepM/ murein hydrolase activator NlpD